ncbi:MAG TPA: cupin domain-containing protein [Clostridiaceae bacterium]|nr:cupin domain-containing protein [Clostridiaceae bacterium]
MKTTEFIPAHAPVIIEGCHGGVGPFSFNDVLKGMDPDGYQCIKFIHNNHIPPKTTFGIHQHHGKKFEEWYYCLEGSGIVHLDGKDYVMNPGDIAVCRGGGVHGLTNNSDSDLHIIVICAEAE